MEGLLERWEFGDSRASELEKCLAVLLRLKSALAAPGQHREKRAVIYRGQTKMAPGRAIPHRQPDHSGYRQVPKLWGQMPLTETGSGTESADETLGASVLGLAPGAPGLCARVGEAQEPPHPPGVVDRPFDQ